MLDLDMRRALNLIDWTTVSFHIVMSSLLTDKTDLHIHNEPDYALGLAHGMILTGFISDFKDHEKREPNQEEMIEIGKVIFDRTEEAILKSE
jgi:hypothetical protein